MKSIHHDEQYPEEWRTGVSTRLRVSGISGSQSLCVFEQWCAPGTGAPTHLHHVEEILSVLSGKAEIWVGDEHGIFSRNESVIVPAGVEHGFRNCGQEELHLHAILAAPYFEAIRRPDGEVTVRWKT